jgi:hypothetical protein
VPRSSTYVYLPDIVGLKRLVPDILHDYPMICADIQARLGHHFNDAARAHVKNSLALCKQMRNAGICYDRRLYVTSNLFYIALFVPGIEPAVADHLKFGCDLIAPIEEDEGCERWLECLEFRYPSVWLFEKKDLVYRRLLHPSTFGDLLMTFVKENLVDYMTTRRHWLYAPRQAAARNAGKPDSEEPV